MKKGEKAILLFFGVLMSFVFFLVIIHKRLKNMKVMERPAPKILDKPSVRIRHRTRTTQPVFPNQHNARPTPYGTVKKNLSLAMQHTIKYVEDRNLG